MVHRVHIETDENAKGSISVDGEEVKNVTRYSIYHEAGERPNVAIAVACSLGAFQFNEAHVGFTTNLFGVTDETILSMYEVCKIELDKRGLL